MSAESYTRHNRLVTQIREIVEVLAEESKSLRERASRKNYPRRTGQVLDRSAEELKRALLAVLIAAAAVREADAVLRESS